MTVSVDEQSVRIGKRIRSERKSKGLTLKLLGEQVGFSVPYLSQIENGRVNLNITTLESISRALGLPMIDLFVESQKSEISLVRRSERRWLDLGGQATESLLVKVRSNLEIFSIRLPPHSDSIQDSSHEGEEFTFVIKGSVRMVLDNNLIYDLTEGDIIYYLSDIPHRWQNETGDDAEILVVNTPATY
jgi:transcriptional regulator with XRE-family HTH domain